MAQSVPLNRVLVTGASGQIGHFALPRLRTAGYQVIALSRQARQPGEGVHWIQSDLFNPEKLPEADAVVSCGPLNAMPGLMTRQTWRPRVIVAFSSTSLRTKASSSDPDERDVAARLARAEADLHTMAGDGGARLVVLRPTMIYGAGLDTSVSLVARHLARLRWFPVAGRGRGLRQPVHADDLAAAAVSALTAGQGTYELGGGEVLSYRDMVRRIGTSIGRPPRFLPLPLWSLRLMMPLARRATGQAGLTTAMFARMANDLVVDHRPAIADLDYAPGPFRPDQVAPPRR